MAAISDWARYSVPDDFWPVAIIAIVLCGLGFFLGFYFFYRMRVLQNIPTSKIRSAAQGYLELTGKGNLLEGPEIIAPLTGRTCTWYSYLIQERRRSGKNSRWVTVDQGTSEELFLLADDTGKCVIDPEGASVIPSVSNTWYGTTARPVRSAGGRGGFLSGGRYRYTEKRMHPGDDLYAIGFFQTLGGASSEVNVSSDVLALLKEWKADSERLLKKFDHNRDGEIDLQEWEAVRKAALEQVMSNHKDLLAAPPVNMMMRTRDSRRPYILSALPQDRLIKRYRYYASGLIVLFFVSGIFMTWILNLRLSGG